MFVKILDGKLSYFTAKFEAQDHVMDVLPAFGFWLFPLEAMKMMVNESDKSDRCVFDMSMVIPGLGVSVMHGR